MKLSLGNNSQKKSNFYDLEQLLLRMDKSYSFITPHKTSIIIVGPTGSGKTLFARTLIEESDRTNFKIGNGVSPETIFLNKGIANDVVIWDCPGFEKNTDIVAAFANRFSMQRLFELSDSTKFILVIKESSLNNYDWGLVSIIEKFINLFPAINFDYKILEKSLALVVTHVDKTKSLSHLEIVKKISSHLPDGNVLKNILNHLGLSIYNSELAKLEDFTSLIPVKINILNPNPLPTAAKDLIRDLCSKIKSNICEINDIVIKFFNPTNFNLYLPLDCKSIPVSPYFPGLAQIFELRDIFNQNDINDNFLILQRIFKAIEKFSANKEKIQDYAYRHEQQKEYLLFFTPVPDPIIMALTERAVKYCNDSIKEVINHIIESIAVKNNQNLDYYEEAINALNEHSFSSAKINETKAIAYYNIGLIHAGDRNFYAAIKNYLKALECGYKQIETYLEIANLLIYNGSYDLATKYYTIGGHIPKALECIRVIIDQDPTADNYIKQADYFCSHQIYSKALASLSYAEELIENEDKLEEISKNKLTILEAMDSLEDYHKEPTIYPSTEEVKTDLTGVWPDLPTSL